MNLAASIRGTQGNGSTPIPVDVDNSPKVGGLYLLQIAGTPEFGSCILTPLQMYDDQLKVFTGAQASLTNLWHSPTSTVRDHLNVVSADYVDGGWLWTPIVNMNVVPTPPDPPAITGLTSGPGQVSVAFSAPADRRDRADHVLPGGRLRRHRVHERNRD